MTSDKGQFLCAMNRLQGLRRDFCHLTYQKQAVVGGIRYEQVSMVIAAKDCRRGKEGWKWLRLFI